MSDYKSALLHLNKGDDDRYMIFESHIDALETASRFKAQGWGWMLSAYETYPAGELPADVPPKQSEMKLGDGS